MYLYPEYINSSHCQYLKKKKKTQTIQFKNRQNICIELHQRRKLASEHRQRCSRSLGTRETRMQPRIMRRHRAPVRTAATLKRGGAWRRSGWGNPELSRWPWEQEAVEHSGTDLGSCLKKSHREFPLWLSRLRIRLVSVRMRL